MITNMFKFIKLIFYYIMSFISTKYLFNYKILKPIDVKSKSAKPLYINENVLTNKHPINLMGLYFCYKNDDSVKKTLNILQKTGMIDNIIHIKSIKNSIWDSVKENYDLSYAFDFEKCLDDYDYYSGHNTVMLIEGIDEHVKNNNDYERFYATIAVSSYNEKKYFAIGIVHDKEIYDVLLSTVNGGYKVKEFLFDTIEKNHCF